MKSIKKIIGLTVILATIMNISFSKDSHALIGLAFKSKPVKIIGGIGAGVGVIVGAYGYGVALTVGTLGALIAGAVFIAYGIVIAGVGLIILDDQQIADIEFKTIDVKQPSYYEGFTAAQVETYNSEIYKLNGIRQTMIAEANDKPDTADAEALWAKYKSYLSPDTIKIAEAQAAKFLRAIQLYGAAQNAN